MSTRILVVGATSASAEAAARIWAARGAVLVLAGRSPDKLALVAGRLGQAGAAATHILEMDVEDPASMAGLVHRAAALAGGLDGVLVAHGSLTDQTRAEADPAYLAREIAINLTSAIVVSEAAARLFEAAGRGGIVVIGSVAGDRGKRRNYAYGQAKAALATFVAGLRHRFAGTTIRAVIVKPGPVDTPMTATHRKTRLFATADEVGRIVAAALEDGPGVVYAPGRWRWIMLVLRLLPERLFVRLDI
jgi:NAD(P)-dependent dehydrogenase (short-subunit alcohol dehydrogenase family)